MNKIITSLAVGSMLRFIYFCAASAVALVMLPFLVQNLGEKDYALWVLVGAFVGYYAFADFGIGHAVGRFVARAIGNNDEEQINRIFNTSLGIYLYVAVGCLILTLITFLICNYLVDANKYPELSLMLLITGITIVCQFPIRAFGGIVYGFMKQHYIVYVEFYRLLVRSTLTFYFIVAGYSVLSLAYIGLFTELTSYVFEVYFAKKTFTKLIISRKFYSYDSVRELFSYSWISFITFLAGNIRGRMLLFIAPFFAGAHGVVLMSIALRLLDYFEQFITNITTVIMPVFSKLTSTNNNNSDIIRGFTLTFSVINVVCIYIGISLVMYGEPFIQLWMGREYLFSYNILVLLTMAYIIMLSLSTGKELLFGMAKHKYCAIVNGVSVGLSLILSSVLGYYLGMIGVVYGVMIGIILPELSLIIVIPKLLNTSISSIFFGDALKMSLLCILFFVGFYPAINTYIVPSWHSLIVCNIIQCVTFGIWFVLVLAPTPLQNMVPGFRLLRKYV